MKSKSQVFLTVAMIGFVTLACDMGTGGNGGPPDPPSPGDTIVNSLGMTMAWVPPGTFTKGSPEGESGRIDARENQVEITLSQGFWMFVHQVTQSQYVELMGNNPSQFLIVPLPDAQARRPVERVSWYDAIVFANMLSIREGLSPAYRILGSTNPVDWGPVPASQNAEWNAVEIVPDATGYRLPTSAQWEWACRADTTTAFNDGLTNDMADHDALELLGWFSFNTDGTPRQVALKAPNAWGLYDMHGNLFDWTWDLFDAGFCYSDGPSVDPTGPISLETQTYRVYRGGSFIGGNNQARSAHRGFTRPYVLHQFRGLRLIRPY